MKANKKEAAALVAARSKKKTPSGRLPVPPAKAAQRLAGRGGESAVMSVEELENSDEVKAAAAEILRINREIAALEEEKDTHKLIIRSEMSTFKSGESWSVRSEDTDWIATYIKPKPTKKLEPHLLVLAGVTPKQLAKGYKTVPAKDPYVQVRTKANKGRENNEENE